MRNTENLFILGINGLGNSPSACLVKNGEIIAMAEEERFNRIKESFGILPIRAIKYCIEEADIDINHIQEIAFAWDCNFYVLDMPVFLVKQYFKTSNKTNGDKISNIKRAIHELIKYHPFRVRYLIKKSLQKEFPNSKIPRIKFLNHHESHAASVYFASGLKSSTVLVLDGSGENSASTIWHASGKSLLLKQQMTIPNSLGWFYQALTEFLGFKPNSHEGKTMALACYGEENEDLKQKFNQILTLTESGYQFNADYAYTGKRSNQHVYSEELIQLLGNSRLSESPIKKEHQNIAYQTQKSLERTVTHLLQKISNTSWFEKNICIAGGVALNCKMNGVIAQLPIVEQTYVSPFSSDIGTAYGSAIIRHNILSAIDPKPLEHAYWGPCFTDAEIEKSLKNHSVKYRKTEDIELFTAQLLAENKIIGWFQGRMEIGSRALGNRSILANPIVAKNRTHINLHIKNREDWRPFAVSILHEKKNDFFDKSIESPYMALAFSVKQDALSKIPAGIHIDGTTRPQIVHQEMNSKYWKLIHHFGNITNVYALLNTSFNLKEEPIVCTPDDAIKTFTASNLDFLMIGNFVVQRINE